MRHWAPLAFFFVIFLLLMGQRTLGKWSAPFYSQPPRKGIFQWVPQPLTKRQIQILQNSKLNKHCHQKKISNEKSSSLSMKTTKDRREYLLESWLPQLFGSSFLVPSGLLGFEVCCLNSRTGVDGCKITEILPKKSNLSDDTPSSNWQWTSQETSNEVWNTPIRI